MTSPFLITGRISFFGGPKDKDVGPNEDLALYERKDVADAPPGLFLARQPEGTTGTARRLNPGFPYIAMRWAYTDRDRSVMLFDRHGRPLGVCLPVTTSRSWLKRHTVLVSNPKKPWLKPVEATPCDWGPNSSTQRIADAAPVIASLLELETDDNVQITVPV